MLIGYNNEIKLSFMRITYTPIGRASMKRVVSCKRTWFAKMFHSCDTNFQHKCERRKRKGAPYSERQNTNDFRPPKMKVL